MKQLGICPFATFIVGYQAFEPLGACPSSGGNFGTNLIPFEA
jgi:hypothetical protein